ncbi:MAG TPA: DEAD/DEAH box helicase family protein, partial [Pyrinomonadaceae bacterium]|nr:DEAD/DEAH box helicase family protein [Pyrinomonadaceae bacterium]
MEIKAIRAERAKLLAELSDLADEKVRDAGGDPTRGDKLMHGGAPMPSVKELTVVVKLARTYVQEGTILFSDAVRAFIEDFGERARLFARAFEIAWEELKDESPEIDAPGDFAAVADESPATEVEETPTVTFADMMSAPVDADASTAAISTDQRNVGNHVVRLIAGLGLADKLKSGRDFKAVFQYRYFDPLTIDRTGEKLTVAAPYVGGGQFRVGADGRLVALWHTGDDAINPRMASSVDRIIKEGFLDALPTDQFKVDPELEGLTPRQRGLIETADLDTGRIRLRHVPTGQGEVFSEAVKALATRGLVEEVETFRGKRYVLTAKGRAIAERTQPDWVKERDERIARNLRQTIVDAERKPEVGEWVRGIVPGYQTNVFKVESTGEGVNGETISGIGEDGTNYENEILSFYAPLVTQPEIFTPEAENSIDAAEAEEENSDHVEHSGGNLESDSAGGSEDGLRAGVSDSQPGRTNGGSQSPSGASGATENSPAGRARVSRSRPATRGARSNPSLLSEASADETSLTGTELQQRSDDVSDEIAPVGDIPTEAVRKASHSPQQLTEKRALQRAADSLPTELADLDNIRATLPFLLPEQQEDVLFAEQRFVAPGGYGVLFTNGTGTGKTYTGLGIVKRFARRGKDNILILAPSDKVCRDWVSSAENLGLTIKQLEGTKDNGQNGGVVDNAAPAGNDTRKLYRHAGETGGATHELLSRDANTVIVRRLDDDDVIDMSPDMFEDGFEEVFAAKKQVGRAQIVVTTYANFYQNNTLAARKWDLIVPDESHYLGNNIEGRLTEAAEMLRALSLHPEGIERRAAAQNPDYGQMIELRAIPTKKRTRGEQAELDRLDS